jgi:3-oxoacyl-[acyl-carrier protein] reductase
MNLHGKTVVITGGGRGIGRQIARSFAERGANIALFDLNEADLSQTVTLCRALGVRAERYIVNVTQEESVARAMDQVLSEFGRLDVQINNAGITKDALLVKVKDGVPIGKMSLEQWNAVVAVNLTGVFLCGREAAERMIRRGEGGVIINISSISRYGNVGQTNYSATKAGVAAMAETWAKELARYGIRTGAIAPGFTRTEILNAMKPEALEKLIAMVPLRRLGDAAEIAHSAIYIVENDFFTGRCIDCDGGLRM